MPSDKPPRTPREILNSYFAVGGSPEGENERQALVGTMFRVHFFGPVIEELEELKLLPESDERASRARNLRVRVEEMQALMLEPAHEFLVEGHARHLQMLLDEIRELI